METTEECDSSQGFVSCHFDGFVVSPDIVYSFMYNGLDIDTYSPSSGIPTTVISASLPAPSLRRVITIELPLDK